jgi:uncharacterized protein YneF (UPF0154 family)
VDKTLKIVIILVCVSAVLVAILGWTFLSFLLSQKNIGGKEPQINEVEPQINKVGYKRYYDSEGEYFGSDVTLQYLGSDPITVTIVERWESSRSIVVQPSELFVVWVSKYADAIVGYNGRQLVLNALDYRPWPSWP